MYFYSWHYLIVIDQSLITHVLLSLSLFVIDQSLRTHVLLILALLVVDQSLRTQSCIVYFYINIMHVCMLGLQIIS